MHWLFVIILIVGINPFASAKAATISGTVTDSVITSPIGGVPVYLYEANSGNFANAYDVTDHITGGYSISSAINIGPLPAGEYVTQAYGASVGNCSNGIDVCGYVYQYSDNIIVTETEVKTGVDFALELGGAIEGTVLGDCLLGSSLGIKGLGVYTYADNHVWVNVSYTDADGNFHQGGLKGGKNYKIEIVAYGTNYNSKFYDGTFLVTAGQLINVGTICLESGGSISGTVTDSSTGSSIPGLSVTAYTGGGRYVSNNFTANDGSYTISGLPLDESYFVDANAYATPYVSAYYPTPVVLTSSVPDVIGINFAMETGCSISGRVVDGAGLGINKITVEAYHAYSFAWTNNALTLADDPLTTGLQEDGFFIIQGLPADGREYRLEAITYSTNYVKEFYQNVYAFENATVVNCDAANQDIQLAEGQSISGVVTVGGVGMGGITVNAYEYDPNWEARPDRKKYHFYKSIRTGLDGTYSIGGLWSGRQYIVEANTYGTNYVGLFYNNVIGMDTASLLTAPQANVNFALTAGASISGVVTSGGVGIGGLTMSAYLETTVGSWNNYEFQYITGTETLSDGTYVIDGLPTAPYTTYTNYVIECNTYGLPYIGEVYNEA